MTVSSANIQPQPHTRHLLIAGPGWRENLRLDTVGHCQLYNTMEARVEWHPVVPEWESLTETANGWQMPCRVDIPFVRTVIEFTLESVDLPEKGVIELRIPAESLVERDTALARLMRLDLLPEMGSAAPGTEGYLLMPTLCGSLHRFTHAVSREARIAIYARQDQWAMKSNFNCIGMHTPGHSWCSIVTDGEFDAEAVVRSHWQESHTYSIHTGLVYRWLPADTLVAGDRAIRYHLFDPVDGGWQAFGRRYRDFLRRERGLRTWKQKAEENPDIHRFARSFVLKVFQGCKRPSLDGTGAYDSCTSFAETRELLHTMRADGIGAMTAQLVGWNDQGHDGAYPSRFPVNKAEGGEEELRELSDWARDNNCSLSAHDNYYDAYQISPDFSLNDLVVLPDGSPWRNVPWAGGFAYKMCPIKAVRHLKRDLPRLKELFHGNYYVDALGAFNPCRSPEHPANRAAFLAATREMLTTIRDAFGTLSLEIAFGPYFDLIDGVYMPTDADGAGNFTRFHEQFCDAVVPFLSIVLHNGVRYHALAWSKLGRRGALKSLAWGCMPFIEIAARSPGNKAHGMPTYTALREFSLEANRLCCGEHVDLLEQDIEAIEEPAPELTRTTYANGTELFVNASTETMNVAGQDMPALSARRNQDGMDTR